MAGAARCDVASVCLCVRRMTAKTRDVRIQSRWNRERNATAIFSMTGYTTGRSVLRMIEPDIETAQRWKSFELSALNVRVTDSADFTCRI